jgi:hypothetical protein
MMLVTAVPPTNAEQEVSYEPDDAGGGGGSADDPWKLLSKQLLHG